MSITHARAWSLVLVAAGLLACDAKSAAPAEAPASSVPSAPSASAADEGAAPERAAGPTDSVAQGQAELGKPAIDFTLTAVDGTPHTLSRYAGKTVVLEWFNPDCPFVKGAYEGVLKGMAERVANDDRVWLSINSGGPGKQGHGAERNAQAIAEHGLKHPVLLDETGIVGKAYGASNTPHLYVIDAKGVLVYRGAIDNAPMGSVDADRPALPGGEEGARVNYVEAALEDLAAGRAVRIPETRAYGCSVKYAS